ncbi:MAG: pyruvate kinase [Methylomonas sp.]
MAIDDLSYSSQDLYLEMLEQLRLEVNEIKCQVAHNAELRLKQYAPYFPAGAFTKSAINLAAYLALRQFDLRHLQQRLAQAGLSSLGRSESSVLSTLDAVLDVLNRATNNSCSIDAKNPSENGFNRGHQLLEQHTIQLFGQHFQDKKGHVMVTLATDTAWDYQLINALLNKGMTCARINCAHDNPNLWRAMIRNIRRAEAESGFNCRVLMDLAGHKIRTGDIELGPTVHHLKVKCDEFGHCVTPGRLVLFDASAPNEAFSQDQSGLFSIPVANEFFKNLTKGCEIKFIDTRDKARTLIVEKALSAHQWQVKCDKSSYIAAGCDLTLIQNGDELLSSQLGRFTGKPKKIMLFKGDQLLLTDHAILGSPAIYDDNGKPIKPAQIGCTLADAINKLKVGDPVWLDDGKIGAEVESISDQGALLKVTKVRSNGVSFLSDKGINFPETDLELSPLSKKDFQDLDFACTHADLIGFSFVESLADMECLMKELADRDAGDLPIIAKIETNRAVKNLPEIILGTIGRHSLGIMIARGDLAVELGSARLAEIQEELLWLCEAAHVPVIWATQVLESIAKKGTKSRAEFTDAAMAVRAECVMLNKGPYIVDALEALLNVMTRMEEHQYKKFPRLRALHW